MTTSSFRWWTVCAMALVLGGSAAAQSPGELLVGGFGQWTHFNREWDLDTGFGNSIGIGGRVGAFISPIWNFEVDGSYTPANSNVGSRFLGSPSNTPGGEVKASALTARMVYNFPTVGVRSFHIGAGGILENYRGTTDVAAGTYQLGVNALGGITLGAGAFALRVDGVANYLPANGGILDFGVQAGLQLSHHRKLPAGTAPVVSAPYVWWGDSLDAPLPGTVEIGGFLQATHFSDSAGLRGAIPKNGLGFGARAGVFLMDPRWEIELDGYYSAKSNRAISGGGFTPTNRPTEVNAHAFATRLNFNYPLGGPVGHLSQLIVGAGAVRTSYKFGGGTGSGSISDAYVYNYGLSGLVGVRTVLSNRTAVRFDGTLDAMPNAVPSANLNFHLRGGVSVLVGGARSP